ncbi:MAG: PorV/PorQ family protein [Candidatus Margulisiibacteriota bacterium]
MKLVRLIIITAVVVAAVAIPALATSFTDPLQIAVGARPLGMGKAYVAVAEEAETLFINPAGLGMIKSAKLTSMYTTLMGDVNYMMVGGVYPWAEGSVGLGYASAGVSEIALYDSLGTSTGTGSWNDSVLFASYGTDLARFGIKEKVQVGGTLKYYASKATGSASAEAGNGSGLDVDLGVLYHAKPWLNIGANLQNILPENLGGKITRKSGENDAIESVAKIGAKVNVLGLAEEALNLSDQKLSLAADIDYYTQSGLGMGTHVGAEYWPVDALALRVGLDSEPSAAGSTSNITAGMGIRYSGLEFDYAYHPYDSLSDDTTHYFSLGYVGQEIAVVAPPEVTIISPEDKFITNEDSVKVIGIVTNLTNENMKGVSVTVNGVNAPMDENGKFELSYQLDKLGKKLLLVKVTNTAKGVDIASTERRILRLASFVDVGKGYWAKSPIENTSTVGLIQGYPDGTFRPDNALTRAELATLLVRAMGIQSYSTNSKPFKDVKTDHWAAEYIRAAKRAGYMAGYPDGNFRPNQKITKVEGITVMARLDQMNIVGYPSSPYADIPSKHWASRYVQAAKDSGMLSYIKTYELKPKSNLTRAESVEMMSKTKFAGVKIKELLSWFVGFKDEKVPAATTKTSGLDNDTLTTAVAAGQ